MRKASVEMRQGMTLGQRGQMNRVNRTSQRTLVAAACAVSLVASACSSFGGKGDVEVEGVLIPQADGNYIPEEAPTVTLIARQNPDDVVLPDGPAVRLAIARGASYGSAKALIARVEAAGKKPIILVGERHRLRAMHLNDKLSHPRNAIRLVATPDGKACVAPPDNPESKCVQGVYSRHVSTAFVREFVREAINGYGLTEVRVFVRPSVEFADVVRSLDGARTCCDGKVTPLVRLADSDNPEPGETKKPRVPGSAMGAPATENSANAAAASTATAKPAGTETTDEKPANEKPANEKPANSAGAPTSEPASKPTP